MSEIKKSTKRASGDSKKSKAKKVEEVPVVESIRVESPVVEPQSSSVEVASKTSESDSLFVQKYTRLTSQDATSRKFRVRYLEFPELACTENLSEEAAILEAEKGLNQYLDELLDSGEKLPTAWQEKTYPTKLEIEVSSSLMRKLDLISRMEKTPIEKLAFEALAGFIEKKQSGNKSFANPQMQRSGNGGGVQNRGTQYPGQHSNQHSGQHRHSGNRRTYHTTMDSRENFMEYVRNLEKNKFK